MAFLKPAGTAPSVSEQLTSLVIEGRRISKHSFTRKVGHGSSMQDLVGDLVIPYFILRKRLKKVKFGYIRRSRKSE